MSAGLPELAVNRGFMAEFVAAEPPCFALGLVAAMVALGLVLLFARRPAT